MVSIVQTGTAGTEGSDPDPIVGPGGSGGPGSSLDVTNSGNGTDTTNTTRITGGTGGAGGNAFSTGTAEAGGNAGAAGNGTAVTKPNPLVASAGTITSKATGIGGAGGQGGLGAYGGFDGAGTAGGNGFASAYAYNNPSGAAYAYGLAEGGVGGFGLSGGNGGIGQIGTVVASGTSARAVALQYGGAGGVSFDASSGGAGANSKLVNAAGGASEGGTLFLKQTARGGAGGSSLGGGGHAGTAGYAVSQLTFDDTANVTPSKTLQGYSYALAGAGGAGNSGASQGLAGTATASAGAAANATLNLKGDSAIVSKAGAYGGVGGGSTTGGASGGAASAYDRAYSTTTASYGVTARVQVLSGQGGNGGGAGGAATGAVAKAIAPHATGGLAKAVVQTSGANGGEGLAGSPNGGAGGTVSGASAYAYGHSAYAYIRQQGGGGGIGFGVGGVSGTSAESILDNQATGRTTGGTLTLMQHAIGGIGTEGSSGGTPAAGGYAQSILTFNDITANPTHAASFYATSDAYGGAGGEVQGGTGGGAGGAANSTVHAVGAGAVTARAEAAGGAGGGSTGSVLFSGGGNAGNTSVASYAYSTGGTAKAYGADATGGVGVDGQGGTAYGAGQVAGVASVGTIGTDAVAAYAAGVGQTAYAVAVAQGGTGGYGKDGANAAAGAATTLDDAVFGVSNLGKLELRQTAIGGAGGGSTGGVAGQGGNATSTLGFTDSHENQSDQIIESTVLIGYAKADAGKGGSGYSGSTGANGGAAVATLVQKGAYQVGEATAPLTPHGANATGGYGGTGTVGGQGGTAQASDSSTTTNYRSKNVYAYVRDMGGLGGGGTAGAGGAGGNATKAVANANGAKQTGGHAYAKAVEISGTGGTAGGASNTAGAGGSVSGATAYAYGYSAKAVVAQYGGAGGAGVSSANGGAGANSLLNNDVGGATNGGNPTLPPAGGYIDGGYLTLGQTAHGGAGGVGNGAGAAGGTAGYGYSLLNFADQYDISTESHFHAGTLTATIGGYGGNGGVGSGVGTTGGAGKAELILGGYGQVTGTAKAEGGEGSDSANGGSAVANATITSVGTLAADTVTATATATGGFTSGTMGTANADAAAFAADGQQATATATAYGTGATDQTSAQTKDSASTLVLETTANTSTTAPLASYDETMTSGATIGGTGELLNSAAGTAFSWASGLPTGTAVTLIIAPTLLQGQPNPYSAIDGSFSASHDSDATVLGYGVVGADTIDTTSGATIIATQTYYLTAAALAGELELGLASGAAYGAVNDVTLTVTVGGTTERNIGYTSVSQMVTFFTDDVQDLGSFSSTTIPTGGLPVVITLSATTTPGTSTVSGFEGNFVLGSSGVVSPPVINLTSSTDVIGVGQTSVIDSSSISEAGDTTGDTFTVTITDTHGVLFAMNKGGGPGGAGATVTQVSSTDVKIVGSLSEVNASLGDVSVTNGTTGSDTIVISASDTNGNSATPADIAVTVNGLPVITTPVYDVDLAVDQPTIMRGYNAGVTAIIPIGITESGNTGAGETFTVDVTDSDGKLAEGFPIAGVTYTPLLAGSELQIEGTLSEVNGALGEMTAQNLTAGTITVTATDSFNNVALQQSFSVAAFDTPTQIAALTQTQINQLATDGVTVISCLGGAALLTVQQAGYFAAAGISITDGSGVFISDTATAIAGLSTTAISALPGVGVTEIIANNGSLVVTVQQALKLEAEDLLPSVDLTFASTPAGSVALTATVDDFDDPASPTYLSPSVLGKLGSIGITSISVTGATGAVVPLSIAQAQALAGGSPVVFIEPPTSGTVALTDTAAAIEALQPTDYLNLDAIGIDTIAVTNGSLALSVNQVEALVDFVHASVVVNAGATVTIDDTASNITGLLDEGASSIVPFVQYVGFTSLNATDGSVGLTAAEADTLESVNAMAGSAIAVTAPAGDSVALVDTAADIETMMSPAQLSGLSAIGVTTVTVIDQSLTLTVAQALALYDPLPISVPPGATVIIADTEAEIDSLTATQIAGLAALGVTTIEVSNLTGAAPLTIDAGVTLTLSGAVPANETITFLGAGGVLALNDTVDMAGTIFGLAPTGTIDLTDVTYDPTSSATLQAGNTLQVFANGNTYDLLLDPSQVFLTTTTFTPVADTGTGTVITVTEAPVTSYVQVFSGQTVDGVVVVGGGEVEVFAGGIANDGTVSGGGEILVDNGATLTGAVIDTGGLLDLTTGGAGFGTIGFGAVVAGVGGTLEIDDGTTLTATLTGLTVGDTIDLTAIDYDSSGSASITAGNTLQVVENGNTYALQLDPSQDFLNTTFTLSVDAGVGTDIGVVQAPVSTGVTIASGLFVDGALVISGGTVEVQAAATLNNGTVGAGGTVSVDTGGTLDNALINAGGLLTLSQGGATGDAITFGTGGTLEISGSVLPAATIYGFALGDTIDLGTLSFAAGATATIAGGVVSVISNGVTDTLNLAGINDGTAFIALQDQSGTGTDITLPCFLVGTRIATPNGEVAVETLAIGDGVTLADGTVAEIEWIGHREVDATQHPAPRKVWPVRIAAGAFGAGQPRRELFLSPDHAVFVEEVLIPVKYLINGTTIAQVPMDNVTYFHIKLPQHEVVLAEGLTVESYLDTGDRCNFDNAGGVVQLFPDFSSLRFNNAHLWEAYGCAPLILCGRELEAARELVSSCAASVSLARSRCRGSEPVERHATGRH